MSKTSKAVAQESATPDAMRVKLNADQPKAGRTMLLAALAIVAFFLIYLLRLDRAIGLMLDDAWYVLLAKALATGQGYKVINSPSPGIHPLYPPGFPALLSLAFRLWHQFPQNVYLLKSISVAAMFGVGCLSYVYFKRDRALSPGLAIGLAAAAVLSPPLVVLATSTVMSECVFAFAFLATVVAVERCSQQDQRLKLLSYALAASALASYTFLTRSMAAGLVLAGVLYLAWKRLFVAAGVFAAGVATICLPWMIYSRLHAPTAAQIAEQNGHIVRGYGMQFWDKVAGYPQMGQIGLGDLPGRVWNNLTEIAGMNIGAITVNPLFPGLSQGMGERWGGPGTYISLFLSVVLVIGFIAVAREKITFAEIALPLSLAAPLSWGFAQFRYLAPFTPFVLFYLLMGLRFVVGLHLQATRTKTRSDNGKLLGAALCATLLLSGYSHLDHLSNKLSGSTKDRPRWLAMFDEHEKVISWVGENLPKDAILVTQNPALVNLYTGHKTVNFDAPAERWPLWNQMNIRYLVRTSPFPIPDRDPKEQAFRQMYRTDGELKLRVLDLGDPAKRPVWGGVAPR